MNRHWSVFSYLGARIAASICGLFTIKFLIDFIAKADYGQWGVWSSASGMLVPVLTLTLPAAMMRMYFDLPRDDRGAHVRLITTTFNLSLAGAAILLPVSAVLMALRIVSPLTALYLVTGVTGAIAFRFFNYLTRLLDNRGMYFFNEVGDRVGFMALLSIAGSATGAWLIAPFGGNRLLAAVVFFGVSRWIVNLVNIAYYVLKGQLAIAWRSLPFDEIRAMVRFSTPVTLSFFLGWVLSASDVFLLDRLSNPDDLANYVFATSVAGIVAVITQAVLTDWPRFYYEQMRDDLPDRDDRIAERAQLVLWMHVLGIAVLRTIAPLAYDLYGAEAYVGGLQYLHYLVLANFFFLAGNLFGSGMGYAKKTHLSLIAFGLAGGLNVALNLWLIPYMGAFAAALTTLGCNIVFAVASWWMGRRHYDFHYPARHVVPAVAALVVSFLPLHLMLPQ